jgi:plasmid maintenance system antidote protein VapI
LGAWAVIVEWNPTSDGVLRNTLLPIYLTQRIALSKSGFRMEHRNETPSKPHGEQPPTRSMRLYLQGELLRRCEKNPGYSLRSFARALQLSPSSLSRILKGERAISETTKKRLIPLLGLSPEEAVSLSIDKDPALGQAYQLRELSHDSFALISDWYHYAILELTQLRSFQPKAHWIASALGITVSEVNAAIERLLRLGLLNMTQDGDWLVSAGSNTNVSQEILASAHRKLQKQILEMALEAVEEVPIKQRDQSSMTMAISTRRLPEAIEKITSFRRELCAFLEQDGDRDEVYQLSISLFPLTQIHTRKK